MKKPRLSFSVDEFPVPAAHIKAKWRPVFVEPIAGSGERLTIGILAFSDGSFYVERANALGRLRCLYGEGGEHIAALVNAALDAFSMDFAERGEKALVSPDIPFSGIQFGPLVDGAAESVSEVARHWMAISSSLYDANVAAQRGNCYPSALPTVLVEGAGDRLPALIYRAVTEKRAGLGRFFREDLRDGKVVRKIKNHKINIDFAGSRLVANFGTLMASRPFHSAKDIKVRLWDLKVGRDEEGRAAFKRQHEMIVQCPSDDDPQISLKQLDNVKEALGELERQADQEEIRLMPMMSVASMAEYVLSIENEISARS